jgi:DNA-binding NtrC family response regulator
VTTHARLLLLADEPATAASLVQMLRKAGFEVAVETELAAVCDVVATEQPDLVIADLSMPGLDAPELVGSLREREIDPPVVVVAGQSLSSAALEAMRAGAVDFLLQPFSPEELVLRVERAVSISRLAAQNRYLRAQAETLADCGSIVGDSDAVRRVNELARLAARTDVPVLVTGEAGTGKELVARTIHRLSHRSSAPFLVVSCSRDEASLELELFGSEAAEVARRRRGSLQLAHGGTVLLEHLAQASRRAQDRIRRFIEDRERPRPGESRRLQADVRIVASVEVPPAVGTPPLDPGLEGCFSEATISVPPLRQHVEDLPQLVARLLTAGARRLGKPCPAVSPEALQALKRYSWPGNVRELENVVQHALITAQPGRTLDLGDLPREMGARGRSHV